MRRLTLLSAGGFVVHHFLPKQLRLPFFVGLSVTGLFLVTGGEASSWSWASATARTLTVLAVTAIFLGIAFLRISLRARVALTLAVAAVLAVLRSGLLGIDFGKVVAIWPVIASLFMFRLIVFYYDMKTGEPRPPVLRSIAYFLLLPNFAATFFPVVDFKKFAASSHAGDPFVIYQRGVSWMTRGVVQLFVHRIISQIVFIPASDVESGTDLIRFILANAFLYLKLSGVFHLFIGSLLLFGFDLPETNNRYFLASSFTDYWRRVNIYWKDFVLKVFYYPAFFRLKARGANVGIVVATLWAFFATWALHLVQTWWLKGIATPTWPDALFWTILGVLVLVNSFSEMRSQASRKRVLAPKGPNRREQARLLLATAATFASICLLWSLWNSPSISAWFGLFKHADAWTALGALGALLSVMAAKYLLEILPSQRKQKSKLASAAPFSGFRAALFGAVPTALILVFSSSAVQSRLDFPSFQPVRDAIANNDARLEGSGKDRGYYESLAYVDQASHDLWVMLMREPLGNPYSGFDPVRPVADFRFREPLPNVGATAYDTQFTTNSLGLRDQEYATAKPSAGRRIALLGSSNVMGWGVLRQETFGVQLAGLLKRDQAHQAEVINFAFNGYSPLAQLSVVERRVAPFSPDVVLLVMHENDYDWMVGDLQHALRDKLELPDAWIREQLVAARVTGNTPSYFAKLRLEPQRGALLTWCYTRVVERVRRLGAQPVSVFLPTATDLGRPGFGEVAGRYTSWASAAGFITLDAAAVLDGVEPEALRRYDHYNPRAHMLIADALYARLTSDPRIELSNPSNSQEARK